MGTAANLMKELDISKSGKLEKIEMRNICEKIIQKAAGVGWHVLTWGFIHGKCDEIATQADRDKDGSIDVRVPAIPPRDMAVPLRAIQRGRKQNLHPLLGNQGQGYQLRRGSPSGDP